VIDAHSSHAHGYALWVKVFYPALAGRPPSRGLRANPNPISRLKYRTDLVDRFICISEAIAVMLAGFWG